MIPTPDRLSDWTPTEIIYICSHCGCSFAFFGKQELYCHNCGTKVDWNRVPIKCTKEFSKKYFSTRDNVTECVSKSINEAKEMLLQYVENIINKKGDR